MSYKFSILLMIIMIIIGIFYGMLFHAVIMPIFNGQLFHCLSIGAAFGFTNYVLVSFFFKKYGALKSRNSSLAASLRTDKLTGLLNRKAFENDIVKQDYIEPYSVKFLDIDNFREYNNKYGHQVGDMVLRAVGSCVKKSVREGDMAYRYGGEEFVLILPDINKEGALRISERIRQSVVEFNISPYPNVSISLGVSNYPVDGKIITDIIKASDMALLKAKASGKNKSVAYGQCVDVN